MGGQHDMTKDKQIEENFSDILSMLKKKVQIDPDFVLEETFKRR